MNIKVVGSCCDKCEILYNNVLEAMKLEDIKCEIEKITELIEIVKLGVMTTPALIINEKAVVVGSVPSVDKLRKLIKQSI